MAATIRTVKGKVIDPKDPDHKRVLFIWQATIEVPNPDLVRILAVDVSFRPVDEEDSPLGTMRVRQHLP